MNPWPLLLVGAAAAFAFWAFIRAIRQLERRVEKLESAIYDDGPDPGEECPAEIDRTVIEFKRRKAA